MVLEALITLLVALNTFGCAAVVWFYSRSFLRQLEVLAKDKAALVKLVEKSQDRIQAQTLQDYLAIRAQEDAPKTPRETGAWADRSDSGEARIAQMRN